MQLELMEVEKKEADARLEKAEKKNEELENRGGWRWCTHVNTHTHTHIHTHSHTHTHWEVGTAGGVKRVHSWVLTKNTGGNA